MHSSGHGGVDTEPPKACGARSQANPGAKQAHAGPGLGEAPLCSSGELDSPGLFLPRL